MKRKKGGKESPNHPANLAVVFPLDALKVPWIGLRLQLIGFFAGLKPLHIYLAEGHGALKATSRVNGFTVLSRQKRIPFA